MVEGKVEIFLSHKEPEYRDNLLWLRPYLDREGYNLLYYGSYGWTPLIDCCDTVVKGDKDTVNPVIPDKDSPTSDDDYLDADKECIRETLDEILMKDMNNNIQPEKPVKVPIIEPALEANRPCGCSKNT